MNINKGTVWHSYSLQCPLLTEININLKKALQSGIALSALTNGNVLHCISNGKYSRFQLNIEFGTGDSNLKVDLPEHLIATDNLLGYSINLHLNKILAQKKLLHYDDDFFKNATVIAIKPIVCKNSDATYILFPIVTIYDLGVTQIDFIDPNDYHEELDVFIRDKVGLPFTKFGSINVPLDYALNYYKLDIALSSIFMRFILRKHLRYSHSNLVNNACEFIYEDLLIGNEYVDYAKLTNTPHNLSDIARTLTAMIFFLSRRRSIKEYVFGIKESSLYGIWQGKPNIFIEQHDNQKEDASTNLKSNNKLISSLLIKNHYFYNMGKGVDYHDFRAFNDFSFFSEQATSLTVLSKGLNDRLIEIDDDEHFIALRWDSLIKANLRSLVSTFYEIQFDSIRQCNSNMQLSLIQQRMVNFDEWLRISSKKYGEIQDYTEKFLRDKDIKQQKDNLKALIKVKTDIAKLKDSDRSDKSNKMMTMIFGLLASTSLTPVLIQPLLDLFSFPIFLKKYGLDDFSDAIYFFITCALIGVLILVLRKLVR
ncbi:Uncharacterised protein [Citrobacter koseri]|uniref:Uncharacterized protein n=1 Tax=Citrobacter koseri TaxID=545 RepID=A0A3S4IXN0_CITKO|nr:Uncharacterised protein [Citrobacter koseri]